MEPIEEQNIDFEKMTKEDALKYLGLDEDATPYAIDDKFWQLTKRYRMDTSEEGKKKVEELSTIYDIATGKRDERKEASEKRENAKKYFGKTSDEWTNYFQYTWYKYLIALIALVVFGNLFYQMFFAPRTDSAIVSLGHFYVEDEFYDSFLKSMGYKNPYNGYTNVVVPNDQNQTSEAYSEISATTMFLSEPFIVVSDDMTVKYYFENCIDLTEFYKRCEDEFTFEEYEKLTPVYCSEEEYHEILAHYDEVKGGINEEDDENQTYSSEKVLIGLMITDPMAIKALGYRTLWPDSDPNLVFTIYAKSPNINESEDILIELLRRVL